MLPVLLALMLISAPLRAQLQAVGDGGPGPVKAQHLTAELTSVGPAIAPGGTLQVGLVMTLEEKWHVYWMNAGDSGEPPQDYVDAAEGDNGGADAVSDTEQAAPGAADGLRV